MKSCMSHFAAVAFTVASCAVTSTHEEDAVDIGSRPAGYRANSAFTVDAIDGHATPGVSAHEPNDQSYDVAVGEFNDDGYCEDHAEIETVQHCIDHARTTNVNGAVVVVFIHGWHHGSAWDDTHFIAFRDVLRRLTFREAERYLPTPGGRRVVGIYLAWNGDPKNSNLLKSGWLSNFSFWGRYGVASTVGGGDDLRDTIRTIIAATKAPLPDKAPGQLVMVGHSMGALVLESAFLSLLVDKKTGLMRSDSSMPASCVNVLEANQPIALPDLLLAVNSAADSEILHEIKSTLRRRQITKSALAGGISYSPPLVMSVTSTADSATGVAWRIARLGAKTDGHDASLFTHTFASTKQAVACQPRGEVDFGQNWHGVQIPNPWGVPTPQIAVDLPARERTGLDDRNPGHVRHLLTPIGSMDEAQQVWVFQLPAEIVADHNDIFGYKASTLLLALMQISGSVLSLARDWQDSFE
jgi:hypothetical protein